jgi:hypothetical protein
MFKPSVRHVFAGLAAALALTGCAPESEMTPLPEVREEGRLGEREQGISEVVGYDIEAQDGTYTQRGYIMPRWIATSNHNPTDWIGLFQVGAANDAYWNFEHVANKGRTKGKASRIRIPANMPTTNNYEVRYMAGNNFDSAIARSYSFKVKATPTVNCSSTSQITGGLVPTAHFINLGKSSGAFSVGFDALDAMDRFQVWTDDDRLLYDSGCISGYRTPVIDSNYPNNRVLVLTLPLCEVDGISTGWTLNVECPN